MIMNSLSVKNVFISAIFIWSMGLLAMIGSYFFTLIPDASQQSYWMQSLALVPAAFIGAHMYYRKGLEANGFLLGILTFLVMIGLDAFIKIPLFLSTQGISWVKHLSDLNYWLLGVEVITLVAAYWQIERAIQPSKVTS